MWECGIVMALLLVHVLKKIALSVFIVCVTVVGLLFDFLLVWGMYEKLFLGPRGMPQECTKCYA